MRLVNSGGSATELSLTDACRNGAVIAAVCRHAFLRRRSHHNFGRRDSSNSASFVKSSNVSNIDQRLALSWRNRCRLWRIRGQSRPTCPAWAGFRHRGIYRACPGSWCNQAVLPSCVVLARSDSDQCGCSRVKAADQYEGRGSCPHT